MLPSIELFGKTISLYIAFNGLSVFFGLIIMVISAIHYSKIVHPERKNINYKRGRRSYFFSSMLSFLISYGFLYLGTTLIGKIKFTGMNLEGVAFIGGVLLFIPIFILIAYHLPQNGDTLSQLERTFPSLAFMQGMNRIACTCAGCCFGIPFKYGLIYHQKNTPAWNKYGIATRLFPTAPFEALVMFACFILILIYMKKRKDSLHLFPIFFGSVGLINQFLMGDQRGIMILKIFDVQQIGYIILICIGLFFYFYRKKHPSLALKDLSHSSKKAERR